MIEVMKQIYVNIFTQGISKTKWKNNEKCILKQVLATLTKLLLSLREKSQKIPGMNHWKCMRKQTLQLCLLYMLGSDWASIEEFHKGNEPQTFQKGHIQY
jgi:hypothetical protein